jgi:hypothetical protein
MIDQQISAFITAKDAMENHKKLLEKSRQAVKLEAYSSAEIKAKSRAEKHLASVEQHGGEEPFLQHMFLEAFGEQKCCHPNAHQIIEQEIGHALQRKDPKTAIHAIEQSFLASLSDEIMSLLLPTKKVKRADGFVEEMEAVVELWNQLYLPPEFLELMKHLVEISSEFITPETSSLFASIKEPLSTVAQKFAISLAQDLFRKKLVAILRKCFDMIIYAENLNELCAEGIFPAINNYLLSVFISQEIARNPVKITPFFKDLINAIPDHRDAAYRKTQEELVKIAKAKFREFQAKNFHATEVLKEGNAQLVASDLTDEELFQIVHPLIDTIEKKLQEKKQEPNRTKLALEPKEVLAVIRKHFEGAPVARNKNDIYGQIAMNLLFKIGCWNHESVIGYFIRDSLSQKLTQSTTELRTAYHFLLHHAFYFIKKFFLNRPRMERLLGEAPANPPQHTNEKLQLQTETLARLIYDMVSEIARDKGMISKFVATKIINQDFKAIHELITKIYHEMLGTKILNQNLLMQAIDVVFEGFRASAESLRHKEGTLLQKSIALT